MNAKTGIDTVGKHTLEVISKAGSFNRWMYNQFRQHLKGEIMEIGSGIGNISRYAIDEGLSITLSDYNTAYVDLLGKKFRQEKNVKNIVSIDLLHPDFENHYIELKEKYDTVFLLNVIEHLADDEKTIEHCKFLLRRCGHLIVLAPAYQWLYCKFDKELGHYRRYTLKALAVLFEKQNFSILEKQYFNFAGIAGWFLSGKVLKRKMIGAGEMSFFNKLVPMAAIIDKLIFNTAGLSVIVTGTKN